MPRSKEDLMDIVKKSRKLKEENPSMTMKELGLMFKISDNYLGKLWKKYPEEAVDGEHKKEEIPSNLINEIKRELEETVSGYLYFKNMGPGFNLISIEVKIPAGLKGDSRKRVLYSTILEELEFEEV